MACRASRVSTLQKPAAAEKGPCSHICVVMPVVRDLPFTFKHINSRLPLSYWNPQAHRVHVAAPPGHDVSRQYTKMKTKSMRAASLYSRITRGPRCQPVSNTARRSTDNARHSLCATGQEETDKRGMKQ